MALFKFRKAAADTTSAAAQPESIEALRRRARHRLIGAAVLVLVGVVGFPLLFDTQPRPIPVDIPIEIPDRAKAKPLQVPPPAATGAVSGAVSEEKVPAARTETASAATKSVAAVAPAPAPKPEPKEEIIASGPKPEAKPAEVKPVEPKPAPKAEAKVEAKPAAKPEAKAAEAKPAAAKDDGAKAKALLEGKPVETVAAASTAAAAEGRFIVQVGAFSDVQKAREARMKVERAGLKTYTQVAETKDGKRIRVRVGPYGTKAEADKAAEKIKGLDLPAAILTL
jgi:DedD protein